MHEDQLPRISVIVPAFNVEDWVGDCLGSLQQQEFPREHCEIIVIDNNSSDRTGEIVRQFPGVTVLCELEQSSHVARNRGIAAARAPVLAFLDADCKPDATWLQTIDGAMRDPDVDIIVGSREFGCHSLSLRLIAEYETARDRRVFSGTRIEAYYGYAGNMAVRSSMFERYGLFEPIRRGSDSLFVQKVVRAQGCDGVRYAEEMRVRIQDILRFRNYTRKVFVYARARRNIGDLHAPLALSFRDRWAAFQAAAARRAWTEQMWLGCLLAAGCLAWTLGRALRVLPSRSNRRRSPSVAAVETVNPPARASRS